VPTQTPAAPRARAAATPRRSAMPLAASTGRGGDGVDDLGHGRDRPLLAPRVAGGLVAPGDEGIVDPGVEFEHQGLATALRASSAGRSGLRARV
jgi:hypothetical protein